MYTFNKIANNNWKADKMANNYGYAVKGFDYNFDIEKLLPRTMS